MQGNFIDIDRLFQRHAGLTAIVFVLACAAGPAVAQTPAPGEAVNRDVARIRAATAAFRSLDEAVAGVRA